MMWQANVYIQAHIGAWLSDHSFSFLNSEKWKLSECPDCHKISHVFISNNLGRKLQKGYLSKICTPDSSGAVFQGFFEPEYYGGKNHCGYDTEVDSGRNLIAKTPSFTAAVHSSLWIWPRVSFFFSCENGHGCSIHANLFKSSYCIHILWYFFPLCVLRSACSSCFLCLSHKDTGRLWNSKTLTF